jgi:hypothetical protein
MALVTRVLLILSLGWDIALTAPLFTVLGQEIPANVKIPSPRARRSSEDPAARKEPRLVNREDLLDMTRLAQSFGAR